ncbi:putative high affinity methionine permease [Phaeomoniella chlamydospora]|uniref:Putative high affinity methionine permease n=1 Tax=Phaeomoniella chlamydospora TaxID=158046 RepID=A0A0G2G8D5_PHACM|nr:putative high affinity methionine permease [Phaeomoniella chlamydospora]
MSFSRFFPTKERKPEAITTSIDLYAQAVIHEGSLEYTIAEGGNGSKPSYQEASGAPVETHSPLGYHVGAITIIFLNISKMIGTGIYSTPSSVLTGTGSVGLALLYWPLGFLISLSSLTVYLEYASYFPNRSGSEVVYLEQAYPRPRYLFPVTFAIQTVILSFSSSNAIVLAQYLYKINGHSPTDWEKKGVAVAGYTVAVLLVLFNTRFSFRLSNAIGIVKVITLVFIGITGLVVLGGNTRVDDPTANFKDAFAGTTSSGYGVTNALYKIIFSYAGYENSFNVVNEVKNPVKTLRTNAFLSLLIVAILYQLANIAYFAAVSKADLEASTQVAASLFFTNVFGSSGAVRGLNFLIALSSFGNLLAVLLGTSRMLRECGRQGVLPFPRFWASTRPFGTPTGPYLVKWVMTLIMILAPPAGDAFNFIVDLQVYPSALFAASMSIGLYIVRWRRRKAGIPRSEFRAWDIAVTFNIAANLFILIMPWYPPEPGQSDVSFWYATYVVVGIGIIVICVIYYYVWVHALPKFKGYRLRQELLVLDNGASSHRLVKVPVNELAEWDKTHDLAGNRIEATSSNEKTGEHDFL